MITILMIVGGLDEILKWEYSDEVVPYEIEIINEIYK